MSSTSKNSSIELYTDQTPNGVKISMALEELGLPYKLNTVSISTNVQKEKWFTDINPNGRIPAITDVFKTSDGKEEKVRVFESASILLYLVDQYDHDHKLSYPRGTTEYIQMVNWLMFQNAQMGPMQGQANHFHRYAPERIKYATDRYINESRRVYRVLDNHFKDAGSPYLVGSKCTIADVSTIGWVNAAGWAGLDIEEFPNVKAWRNRMMERPAILKGNDVPHPSKMKEIMGNKEKMDAYAAQARTWIMQGMKGDEKK